MLRLQFCRRCILCPQSYDRRTIGFRGHIHGHGRSQFFAHNTGDAIGNLQLGTAVFRFDRDHWETDGRAILNLSPSEAIRFFRKDLEKVGEEFAHKQ